MTQKILIGLICFFLLASSTQTFGQKNRGRNHQKVKVVRPYKVHRHGFKRNFVIVKPRRFRPVVALPVGYSTIIFKRYNYFYHNGYFYNRFNRGYMLIAPPIGIRIRSLHPKNRIILVGGVPCYYHMGVCYRQVNNEYEVIDQPIGTIVPDLPEESIEEVKVGEQTYYKLDDKLYKNTTTEMGTQYELVEKL